MLGQLVSMFRRSTNKETTVQQPCPAKWWFIMLRARCWDSYLLEGIIRNLHKTDEQFADWVGRCYLTGLLSRPHSPYGSHQLETFQRAMRAGGVLWITPSDMLWSCPVRLNVLTVLNILTFLCLYCNGLTETSFISCVICYLHDFKFYCVVFEGSFEVRKDCSILHTPECALICSFCEDNCHVEQNTAY